MKVLLAIATAFLLIAFCGIVAFGPILDYAVGMLWVPNVFLFLFLFALTLSSSRENFTWLKVLWGIFAINFVISLFLMY